MTKFKSRNRELARCHPFHLLNEELLETARDILKVAKDIRENIEIIAREIARQLQEKENENNS